METRSKHRRQVYASPEHSLPVHYLEDSAQWNCLRRPQTKDKFVDYREGILKVAKEHQNFLKDEIRFHQNKANENLVAYGDSERALARERNKTSERHRNLEELNNKLAAYSSQMPQRPQASLCKKAVDQGRDRRQRDEGWSSFRRHRGYRKNYVPDNQ
ncbi:hypothetical protein SKAU_G00047100 [Synaphobranchus kaupii]|uniref:Uncharacterized protein n=1 Tax=Synaphobranchus kaupii TaxID=118154 RepID=A0A9Q1J9D9_SYNKA|nr:hypothetical protein SKAU_G00047100 [Synaphobranchus kaupii]